MSSSQPNSPDPIQVEVRQQWKFKGTKGACGKGEVHTVIDDDPLEIVTSSGSHSWIGPVDDFLAQFSFVSGEEPKRGT